MQTHLVDGQEYIPEHPFREEKAKIWENQVFLPFSIDNKPYACFGPLPSSIPPNETPVVNEKSYFPTSTFHSPLIAESNIITLRYVERNFRTAPPLNCPKFAAWMKSLEATKEPLWQELGIDTLLEYACQGQPYSTSMLLAATYFWEGSTNTFHTRCGMITPTLLDVAMLTGLKPNNRLGDLSAADAIPIEFKVGKSGKPTYNNFIDYHAKTTGPVSDEEHVSFLTLWLSRYVFCSRSMQVVKQFTPWPHKCTKACMSA